ncbi:MAG: sulfatase-like hydrolase/transferase [Firmicutes bacterium]|nr:sulfatase-like hydrolase/transferase [Candidatus Colimorpha enterica]
MRFIATFLTVIILFSVIIFLPAAMFFLRKQLGRRAEIRRTKADRKKEKLISGLGTIWFFSVFFLYLEYLTHVSLGFGFSFRFLVYATVFAVPFGLIAAFVCSLFTKKVNYVLTIIVTAFFTVYFGIQLIFYKFFKEFLSVSTAAAAGGNVVQFWREALGVIFRNIHFVILLFVPMVLFIIFGRKKYPVYAMNGKLKIVCLCLSVFCFFAGVGYVGSQDEVLGDRYYYGEGFNMSDAGARFGLLTSGRLDLNYAIFGDPIGRPDDPEGTDTEYVNPFESDTEPSDVTTAEDETTEYVEPVDTSPNVLDIDFDKLIAGTKDKNLKAAHNYFANREPTLKNEYTCMFEGKNLIWITVESWAPAAINEQLTPTLYKMKNEGFVFNNYYCSNWGGSTATGEYANITGMFYTKASCLKTSAENYMPFTVGNMLKADGYKTLGFHNWTASYYGRNLSHPNFGYEFYGTKYVAAGDYHGTDGWDVTFKRSWPLSDKDLADYTVSYIPDDGSTFHIYYMTVSGHPYQTWNSSMARRHKDLILDAKPKNAKGEPYTAEYALSYIAAQYEVELMVEKLISELDAKGILDDTVFVMSPDHYPYQISEDETMNTAALSQMYCLPEKNIYLNYELYKAPLIIWSSSMEQPVEINKVCSAIDILPTVLNLFGEEYDSRLIIGRDILSTSEGFVILNMSNVGAISSSQNWITDYGFYNSSKKLFTQFEGEQLTDEQLGTYVEHYSEQLTALYKYSKYILNNDYYRTVFPKGIGK